MAAEETLAEHVALIGLPGAGKSVVARLLGRRLGRESADLDRTIERQVGRTATQIFAAEGEERFRDRESLALAEILNEETPRVIACGGGILGRAVNRELLRSRARVAWLRVDPDEAAARLGPVGWAARPLLGEGTAPERLRALLARREAAYAAAADLTVDTDGLLPEEVADRLASLLTRPLV